MTSPIAKHVSEDSPWLMPEVIDWLDGNLRQFWTVLETGAGGSTVFFARRCKFLISYEHQFEWASRVQRELQKRNLQSYDLRAHGDYPSKGLANLPPLDLAFIDGRGRVRSVIDALPHIVPGGWLILDDSDRKWYAEAHKAADAASSAKIVFRSGTDETTIWRKR